jgi:VWFA-related protein
VRRNRFITRMVLVLAGLVLASETAQPRAASTTTVPVQMMVTVEANHGKDVPAVGREDVMVYQGRERDEVKDWIPLQGDRARLELFILLDDASRANFAAQLEDLRKFVNAQPPVTAVGLGYMRNGVVDIVEPFTTDHAKVANLVRLPLEEAGASANPYLSIVDVIKRWPTNATSHQVLMNRWPEIPVRHEILVVSDGIDRSGGTGTDNPYVNQAIVEAQRAGVIIYTIYAGGVGRYGRSIRHINWGQNYLSEIAEETGGEAFYLGSETAVSFTPYLDDINRRLSHQYLLAFFAKPEKKAGLQRIKLKTEVPNAELVGAEKVYVPAAL